ncbi:hypothetical protein O181_001202 [Austropuccinia psidii MF-1]|uniref:CCHC-type domain-containing protein n=1 Tax=Austropuccinia psidii MF-1 TaxID=1389203 RepID=A0A9Q3GCT2_9BASI|nr:hypothetical protein [Austropuccinia psidii MF-1]
MKPQPQGHFFNYPYHQGDIKPDALLVNNKRSPSEYQDGYNMSYSKKEALKELPEASSWPKFTGTGEYDHMELIDYIDGLFIDVPSISDYLITARLNTAFKGHDNEESQTPDTNGRGTIGCNQIYTLDDIANTSKDVRKRTNIGKYSQIRSSSLKEKQPFRVELKDKPRERVAEVVEKNNSCHNCGLKDHYSNNCPKAKKKVYAIDKVPEEGSPTEDSESGFMGNDLRE